MLKTLDLNTNQLHGELPQTISNITSLTAINVFANNFSGSIPSDFGKYMPSLKFASFSNNSFSGELPPELWEVPRSLTSLKGLQYLDLSNNKLTGNIPKELWSYEKLLSLDLSHNNLSGDIPFELGNLNSLQYLLDLSSNSLSGAIPQNLGKLSQLEILNVSHNHLSGRIPASLSSMGSLSSYDFSYNELTGPLPTGGVFQNASARSFVGNPGLCGKAEGLSQCPTTDSSKSSKVNKKVLIGAVVPVCGLLVIATIFAVLLCYRKYKIVSNGESSETWETGHAAENFRAKCFKSIFSEDILHLLLPNSTIVPEPGLCTNLTSLDLAGNQLNGELPSSLSNLAKIHMGLSENSLSEIGNFKELSNLDLSGNQISGPLPPTLWNLTNLQILDLFFNNINGKIPPEVGNLTMLQLQTLDLNTNQLHGELPQTLSNITPLTSISLFGNDFSGSIPNDLG
ncbi:hypothetical protein OIU76_008529 [Salix suchowensis]|nr:hypothetical protein OIU76_008529 [Salix suchowensis]